MRAYHKQSSLKQESTCDGAFGFVFRGNGINLKHDIHEVQLKAHHLERNSTKPKWRSIKNTPTLCFSMASRETNRAKAGGGGGGGKGGEKSNVKVSKIEFAMWANELAFVGALCRLFYF